MSDTAAERTELLEVLAQQRTALRNALPARYVGLESRATGKGIRALHRPHKGRPGRRPTDRSSPDGSWPALPWVRGCSSRVPLFIDSTDVDVAEFLLATLGLKVGGLPETSVAMMRSMLTHPEAAETARAALGQQVEQIGAVILDDDPRLRAALIIATMLGVTIGQQLLDIEELRDASADRITELLRPCFRALVGKRT
jgi:hypothetical protein